MCCACQANVTWKEVKPLDLRGWKDPGHAWPEARAFSEFSTEVWRRNVREAGPQEDSEAD